MQRSHDPNRGRSNVVGRIRVRRTRLRDEGAVRDAPLALGQVCDRRRDHNESDAGPAWEARDRAKGGDISACGRDQVQLIRDRISEHDARGHVRTEIRQRDRVGNGLPDLDGLLARDLRELEIRCALGGGHIGRQADREHGHNDYTREAGRGNPLPLPNA